jgi:Oxidoreductase molybdopterin binding domain
MRYPWANTALLVLLVAQFLTGLATLLNGDPDWRFTQWLHDIGAWALVALLVWKTAVVVDSIRRRKRAPEQRSMFFLLGAGLLATLVTGFVWTSAGRIDIQGYSLMTVHHVLAYATMAFLISHVLYMKFIFGVPSAGDRRAFLRFSGLAVAGVAAWQVAELGKRLFDLPGASRRFTGSFETGSFTGRFPTVSWFSDDPDRVDRESWRLEVNGEVERSLSLTYDEVLAMSSDSYEALIDCTGGWYSEQLWEGVRLSRILAMAGVQEGAGSVTFESVTGYDRRHSFDEVGEFLLATRVGGETLSHGHGFPVRLVAPGQRGFGWVKWVKRVTVNEQGDVWQVPVPLQ